MTTTPQVKVTFSAEDKTGAAAASAKKNITGVGEATSRTNDIFKALFKLEVAKKILEMSKAAMQLGAQSSPEAAKSLEKLKNVFTGLQAKIGATILQNKTFVTTLTNFAVKVAPIVVGGVMIIVNVLDLLLGIINRTLMNFKLLWDFITGKISFKDMASQIFDNMKENFTSLFDTIKKSVSDIQNMKLGDLEAIGAGINAPKNAPAKGDSEKVKGSAEAFRKALEEELARMNKSDIQMFGFNPTVAGEQYGVAFVDGMMVTINDNLPTFDIPLPDFNTFGSLETGVMAGVNAMYELYYVTEAYNHSLQNLAEQGVVQLQDNLTNAFVAIGQGQNVFKSLGKAAAKTIADMAAAEGRFHIGKGIAKIGSSLFPVNPAGIASGAKEVAAGVGLIALSSKLGGQGGGGGAGGGGGGGAGAGAVRNQDTKNIDNRRPETTVYIQGDRYLDTTNPEKMDAFVRAIREAGQGNIIIRGA